MLKYFLHVRRGNAIYEDRQGIPVDSLETAVEQAKQYAREILRDEPEVPAAQQWFEIVDTEGNAVRTVPFVTVKPAAYARMTTSNLPYAGN
jgi:hypothetical protein